MQSNLTNACIDCAIPIRTEASDKNLRFSVSFSVCKSNKISKREKSITKYQIIIAKKKQQQQKFEESVQKRKNQNLKNYLHEFSASRLYSYGVFMSKSESTLAIRGAAKQQRQAATINNGWKLHIE